MVDQGLSPEECTNDISILQARLRLDKRYEMVEMLVSGSGRELSRGHILERLESQFKETEKAGVVVYYLGHGKRDTGDWCFQDGFITFSDIAELYSRYLHGRVLTIISDCSHSGAWVNACLDYLDERGVRPCGHSAKEKGIFIKVYASCQPEERAATNCFFVQAVENDTNTDDNSGILKYYTTKKLSKSQHCYGASTTRVMCKKSAEEACALRPEFTWRKWREGERIHLVRGEDHGRAAWHYILLDDDPETKREFLQTVASGDIDVADYGKLLKFGWGRDPPQEVKDEILRPYQFML